MKKDIEILSKTGLIIRGYMLIDESAANGNGKTDTVVIFHGLMDSGEFPLISIQAEEYAKAGYAVIVMDFNGHGKSDGKLIDMTIGKELMDAEAIMEYAMARPFEGRLYLIGHSQGGLVASMTAPKYKENIDKLVLLAPAGMVPDNFRAGKFYGIDGDPKNPPEKAELFGDYVGREYMLDAQKYDPYTAASGYADREVLLVAGSEDIPDIIETAIPKYAEAYEANGNKVEIKTVANAPHDFAGHEPALIETVKAFLIG